MSIKHICDNCGNENIQGSYESMKLAIEPINFSLSQPQSVSHIYADLCGVKCLEAFLSRSLGVKLK